MRVVGIDLGSRRVGIAVSDRTGTLASPHAVLERSQDPEADRRALAQAVSELEAERVVVGLPLSLDGSVGPAARAATAEIEALRALLEVPVDAHDERLTTVVAHRSLATAGLGSRARRRIVDGEAAAVLLQSWLDARR